MLIRLARLVIAGSLLAPMPFIPLAGTATHVQAASVTSATYGAPVYTQFVVGSNEVQLNLPGSNKPIYHAYTATGAYDEVSTQCSFWVDNTNVATVSSDGTVTAIAAGTTMLHVQFNSFTASLPVIVNDNRQQQEIVNTPVVNTPTVPQSTLNVYTGVDMTRLADHRQASLSLINSFRTAVGVSSLAFDDSLNKAAQAHANYQELDKQMGHYEVQGKTGFSGASPYDRAQSFGYPSTGVGETVAGTMSSPSGATQVLIDAPYHREILLMPTFTDVGVGVSNGYTVIDPGSKNFTGASNQIVYYPYNGQSNVPSYWLAYETPNPLAYYGKSGTKVGYPISISTSGNQLTYKSGSITTVSGANVDYYLVDSGKAANNYGILLIPKEPLSPSTTYNVTVNFSASEGSSTIDKANTWSFTTQTDSVATLSPTSFQSSVEVDSTIKAPNIKATYGSGVTKDVTSLVQFSSDSNIISISNGSITGISAGQTKVTASYESKTYSFTVTVLAKHASAVPAGGAAATNPTTDNGAYKSFRDTRTHWAKDTIGWAKQLGIADGYADGSFKPDAKVTEAEFLAMLFRMYADDVKKSDTGTLSSEKPNTDLWSDKFYTYAADFNLGLNVSTSNPELRDAVLKRVQVAQIIAGLSGKNYTQDEGAIRYLLDTGYSQGKTDATVAGYAGDDVLTRAEALQFLKNLQDKGLSKLQKRPTEATAA